MTQSTSPNWERRTNKELHNQDSKARGTFAHHQVLEMDHRSLLHDTITRVNRDTRCHQLEHNQHGMQEDHKKEVTKDHQSTQEALMFTLTKIKSTTLKSAPDHQVIKKTHQQAFLQDHR
jgi:hypothetical protein